MSAGTIATKLANMLPGLAGVATPKVIFRSEDGILSCYGTTVPTDAATGYAPGCEFYDVTNGAKYINEGSATSCDFNKVNTTANVLSQIEADDLAGTASGVGPSPLIWDDSKWLEVLLDPTKGIAYFDDFMGPVDVTTGDGFTITQVNSGAISTVADEEGGVLLVDSGGHNAADDGANVQLTNCMVKPVAGRTIRFEARVKFNDNSANTSQFAIGLAGIDTTIIAAGVLDDVVDKALWFHHAASTADKMSVCAARGNAEDIDADKATTVDDTYIKLGFVINGLTSIQWYVNGALVHTSDVTANVPNAVMCLTFVAQVEGTSADSEMSVDWVRVLQEGRA